METKDWVILAVLVLLFWQWRMRLVKTQKSAKKVRISPKARQLLADRGYEAASAAPVTQVRMEIDGRPYPFELKADFLVTRNGRRYLVRLARDGEKGRLQSKAWRSALLLDVLSFRASGIIILHEDNETLKEVTFTLN